MKNTIVSVGTESARRKQKPARRAAAVAMLAATGAILASAIGSAPPANAGVDYFVALAYGSNEVAGVAYNNTNESLTKDLALRDCVAKGGAQCVVRAVAKNQCVALAVFGVQEYTSATASDQKMARTLALKGNPGSHIGASGCATGSPIYYDPSNPPPRSPS